MTTHDKPKAQTIETPRWRIRLTPVLQQPPGGLSNVGWRRSGWEVNAKIVDKVSGEIITEKGVGSLMWRKSGNCAWSIGSVDGLWAHGNTLDSTDGGSWSYKTDQFAFNHLVNFVKHNVENGIAPLTRALA